MKPIHRLFQLGALFTVLAFSANLEAAKGGKPGGGGGGKPEIRFARIQFHPFDAVRSDGVQACEDLADPVGPWDYWDWRDTPLSDPDGNPNTNDGCDAGSTADVSGGGRVHFYTINLQGAEGPPSSPRWLVLDFTNPDLEEFPESNLNPNIDAVVYDGNDPADPPIDQTEGIDNVKTNVSLDNMFKKGATRNPLVITIRNCDDPADCHAVPTGYSLEWVEDLYIQDTSDPDVRIFTTDGTSAQADLFFDHDLKMKTPPLHVGRYIMPIHWTMRIVPSP